jgi:hypothetical protein
MAHSSEIREFELTDHGLHMLAPAAERREAAVPRRVPLKRLSHRVAVI